jgi:hypothetical protein
MCSWYPNLLKLSLSSFTNESLFVLSDGLCNSIALEQYFKHGPCISIVYEQYFKYGSCIFNLKLPISRLCYNEL